MMENVNCRWDGTDWCCVLMKTELLCIQLTFHFLCRKCLQPGVWMGLSMCVGREGRALGRHKIYCYFVTFRCFWYIRYLFVKKRAAHILSLSLSLSLSLYSVCECVWHNKKTKTKKCSTDQIFAPIFLLIIIFSFLMFYFDKTIFVLLSCVNIPLQCSCV